MMKNITWSWCFLNLNPPPRHGAPVSQGLIKFDTDYTERSCWWGCSSCSSKQTNRSELCHNVWAARVITLWPGLSARRSVLWPVWPIRQCHDIIRDNTRRCDRVIVTVTNWQLTHPDVGALWHLITSCPTCHSKYTSSALQDLLSEQRTKLISLQH